MFKDPVVKKIAQGGLIAQIGYCIGKGLRLATQIILTRVLGLQSYGLYALGLGISNLLVLFGSLGYFGGIIRFGSVCRDRKDETGLKGIILTSFIVSQVIAISFSVLLFIYSEKISVLFFHDKALADVLKIFAIGLPFYALFFEILAITIAFHRLKYKTIVGDIVPTISQITLLAVVFLFGWELYGATITFVVSIIISVFVGIGFVRKLFPPLFSSTKAIFEFRKIFYYSFPLVVILLSQALILNINKIMVGIYFTPNEVGIFNIVCVIGLQLTFLTGALTHSFMPVIPVLHNNQEISKLKKYYCMVTRWNTYILFIPVLIIIVFNQEILSLFGSNFRVGGVALILLTLAFFINYIPGNLGRFFEMVSLQKMECYNSIGVIVLNIYFSLIFIPQYGILGAAIAIFLSFLLATVVRLVQLKKKFAFLPFTSKYVWFLIYAVLAIGFSILLLRNLDLLLRAVSTIVLIIGFLPFIKKVRYGLNLWRKEHLHGG